MQIVGHKIPVQNVAKATAFYRDKLGFIVDFEAAEYGWASISRDGAELGLYEPGKGGGTRTPGGSIDFSFVITDFEGYYNTLKASGIGVRVSDVVETNDGMKVFEIVDPDGNEITVRKG